MLTYIYGREAKPYEKVVPLGDVENREMQWNRAKKILREAINTAVDSETLRIIMRSLEEMPRD